MEKDDANLHTELSLPVDEGQIAADGLGTLLSQSSADKNQLITTRLQCKTRQKIKPWDWVIPGTGFMSVLPIILTE